ncbi:MAG: hypothetical protein INR73_15450 [Williamsia sp.]|nr:hypothetical protein [Williamsia sp.]
MIDRISGFAQAVFMLVFPFFSLLCCTCCAGNLQAQLPAPLQLESLNIHNGLSQGFVSGMVQDQKGLMWFTTSDGLNKYDGYQFKVYHNDPDDSTTVGSDDLSCITQDSKGRIWVGTRHNGLDLFDPEQEIFTHIRSGRSNSLRSNNILTVIADLSGHLWVRTDKGVDRMEIQKSTSGMQLRFTPIRLDSTFEAVKFKYLPEKVFTDSYDRVFITTHSKVWEVENGGKSRNIKLIERYRFPVVDSMLVANIMEDTVSHCLLLNNGRIIKFPGYNFKNPVQLYGSVRTQIPWALDQRRQLWLPDSNHLIRIDIPTGLSEKIPLAAEQEVRGIFGSTRYYTDKSGVIWMGTAGFGIYKYNPQKEIFHHILPQVVTYQLAEGKEGEVIANGRFALLVGQQPVVTKDILRSGPLIKALEREHIGSFTLDSAGNYWYGRPLQLIRYDPASGKIQRIPIQPPEKITQPFPMYGDSHNNIWMGYNRYLFRYNISTGRFTRYEYPVHLRSYDYDFLQCIYEDEDRLWLGSASGLFCLYPATGRMVHYEHQPANTRSLSNNLVISLQPDRRQPGRYLWIGTRGGGLNRLDKTSGDVERYTTKDGLPNNVVYGILPDGRGNLWLSTNRGLSAFNPVHKDFKNFDENDGLQSNEFNRYAACRTRGGLLVFGGMNGINYFDPAEIKPPGAPEVVITDFRLFNKEVQFKLPGAPIRKNISFCNEVRLRYEDNVITFQFAAMDYRKPGSARYRYRMEGFDKEWIYSGTQREATYTNLDPGAYRFVVEGSFFQGIWGDRQTSIRVMVVPPWWRTWWFYILALSATASILYALYWYRLHQRLKVERFRNRIARDLHDEVGSSISNIAIYSRIIQEQLNSAAFNSGPLVNKITENAQEIMESMNDIVWNINTKNDAFEHIVNRMREHAYQLFEAKGYTLHFFFDESLARLKLDMEKRRDLYLIYKEALNNIAKYAQGKNVWINVTSDGAYTNLSIRDDGKGFDATKVRRSSNGLSNMHYRATALQGHITIWSVPGRGTEIKLVFPH